VEGREAALQSEGMSKVRCSDRLQPDSCRSRHAWLSHTNGASDGAVGVARPLSDGTVDSDIGQ
jgi:hypothetical protein